MKNKKNAFIKVDLSVMKVNSFSMIKGSMKYIFKYFFRESNLPGGQFQKNKYRR